MLFQGICGYGADSSQSSLVQQFLLIAENLQQVGYGAAAGEGYDACFAAFESFDKLILVFAVGNGFVSSYDVNDGADFAQRFGQYFACNLSTCQQYFVTGGDFAGKSFSQLFCFISGRNEVGGEAVFCQSLAVALPIAASVTLARARASFLAAPRRSKK